METPTFTYTPACRSATPGGCSGCTMAFDCQAKREQRTVHWPLFAVCALLLTAVFV